MSKSEWREEYRFGRAEMEASGKICKCLFSGVEKATLEIGLQIMIDEYTEERPLLLRVAESKTPGSEQREYMDKVITYHDQAIREARALLGKIKDTPVCLPKEQSPSSEKRP